MEFNNLCLGCMSDIQGFDVCGKCGWTKDQGAKEPFQLTPGLILNGRYILGRVISMGGFGIIYHGFDTVLNIHIAIKEFYPNGLVNRSPNVNELFVFSGSKKEQYKKLLSRFLEEGRTMAKFSSDTNIVKVLDYFEENRTAYIIMEFLDGCTLREKLNHTNIIDINEAIEIIIPIMDALTIIHQEKIIHRDVNPNNIFMENNKAKLIDFGSARLSNEELEEERTVILTPCYAPIEQYNQKSKQGSYTDIYAVAATLYRLVTGCVPEESSDRIKKDLLVLPSLKNDLISKELDSIILRGMAIEAKLRFKTINEFKEALIANKIVKIPEQIAKSRRIRRIMVSLLTVLISITSLYYYRYASINDAQLAIDHTALVNEIIKVAVPIGETNFNEQVFNEIEINFDEQFDSHIDVEIVYLPIENYEESVLSGDYDVYRSDLANCDKADLTEIYESINYEQYSLLKNNEEQLLEEGIIPTGFIIPTLYLNRYLSDVIAEIQDDVYEYNFNDYYELNNNFSDLALFSHLYTSEKAESLINSNINEKQQDITKQIIELNELSGINSVDDAILSLQNNSLMGFLGTSLDYSKIQNNVGGNYTVQQPLNNEDITGCFAHTWSVYPTDDETELASMVFLGYLLSDISQNFMFVQNNVGLPINENTLSTNYVEFEFLNERMDHVVIVK